MRLHGSGRWLYLACVALLLDGSAAWPVEAAADGNMSKIQPESGWDARLSPEVPAMAEVARGCPFLRALFRVSVQSGHISGQIECRVQYHLRRDGCRTVGAARLV